MLFVCIRDALVFLQPPSQLSSQPPALSVTSDKKYIHFNFKLSFLRRLSKNPVWLLYDKFIKSKKFLVSFQHTVKSNKK